MPVDKAQVFTIVAGTMKCNAKCPDCVSKMTTDPKMYKIFNFPEVDWDNFEIAGDIADAADAKTALFTGKGESTLYPNQINQYLTKLDDSRFKNLAMKEIQTNGLNFHNPDFQREEWLKKWYENKLRVISLSVVDTDNEINHQFYNPHQEKYPELERTIEMLQDEGYAVRLSVTAMKNKIDSPESLDKTIDFCKKYGVPQLTVRPMRKPEGDTFNPKIANWVKSNELYENPNEPGKDQMQQMVDYVKQNGRLEQKLMHGAAVYKINGQNICLSDCLTHNPDEEGFRQLIFYSCGILQPSWDSDSVRILDVGKKCRDYLKK